MPGRVTRKGILTCPRSSLATRPDERSGPVASHSTCTPATPRPASLSTVIPARSTGRPIGAWATVP
ncbi:MAG: hypothetical protein A3E31_08610 [Candidatus Rokubacteria bacterium RIFCSPHIGHO2_12_FULL_73_22]|nr:MAG: hypothetical protein A3E31_08610 [Candidatus Rokubacteria bacterium RIFCSPHIGHO2_12_FULL_73_22]